MIPHDFQDNRPPKGPSPMGPTDYIVIALMFFAIGSTFLVGDIIGCAMSCFGWRLYEIARAQH